MKTAAPTEVAPVEYMDGVAGDAEARLFVACDLTTGNYDFSRLFVFREQDEWLYWDVDFTVVSVTMHIDPASSFRTAYALGRDGRVWEKLSGKDPTIATIRDAGTGKGAVPTAKSTAKKGRTGYTATKESSRIPRRRMRSS